MRDIEIKIVVSEELITDAVRPVAERELGRLALEAAERLLQERDERQAE